MKHINTTSLKDKVFHKSVILFDMDGTLFNTEPVHGEVLFHMAKEWNLGGHGINFDEEIVGMHDITIYEKIKHLIPTITVDQFLERKNQLMIEFVHKKPDAELKSLVVPGIQDFMQELSKRNIKMGIVSSSEEIFIHKMLESFHLHQFITHITPREETFFNKPSPSPYLLALRKFQVDSKNALVFEDSKPGLTAASGAGIDAIHINHCHDFNEGKICLASINDYTIFR